MPYVNVSVEGRAGGCYEGCLEAFQVDTRQRFFISPPARKQGQDYFEAIAADAKGARTNPDEVKYPAVPVELIGGDSADLVVPADKIFELSREVRLELPGDLVQMIDNTFSSIDISGVAALIVYDSTSRVSPYRFMAVARRSGTATNAIHRVPGFETGSGEGLKPLWFPNVWHPERVIGKRYKVDKDFRKEAKAKPKRRIQGKEPVFMHYVGIEGMLTNGNLVDPAAEFLLSRAVLPPIRADSESSCEE